MNVREKESTRLVKDLCGGDLFRFEGRVYMKVNQYVEGELFAVYGASVSTGTLTKFGDLARIEEVHGTFVEE